MRVHSLVLGLVLPWAWSPSPATAERVGGRDAPVDVEVLFGRLGTPPSVEAVRALLDHPKTADRATALRFIANLWPRGGYAAAQGLYALVDRRDRVVVAAALHGIARVGLRDADGVDHVRSTLGDSDLEVHAAALDAIGRVGDASDVARLLDDVTSENARIHGAAYRALVALTGLRLPHHAARWLDWWEEVKDGLPSRLAAAIHRLDDGGDPTELGAASRFVAEHVWVDVEAVRESARRWVRASDPRQRSEGYRIAVAARLADVSDDVESAVRFEFDGALLPLALASAGALGISTQGLVLLGQGDRTSRKTFAPASSDALERAPTLATGPPSPSRRGPPMEPTAADVTSRHATDVALLGDLESIRRSAPDVAGAVAALKARDYARTRDLVGRIRENTTGMLVQRVVEKGEVAIFYARKLDRLRGDDAVAFEATATRALANTPWVDVFVRGRVAKPSSANPWAVP